MDVTVEVEGDRLADEVRSLREWLIAEQGLRGRVRLAESPPVPGTLGGAVEALTVALGPGGVATAMATVLISWIRHRTGKVTVKVTRADGASFEFTSDRVSVLSSAEVHAVTAELSRFLDGHGAGTNGDAS